MLKFSMMKKRYLLLFCFISSVYTLQAQAFHQAFGGDQTYAQFSNAPKLYASRSTLNNSIDIGYKPGIKIKTLKAAAIESLHPSLSINALKESLQLKIDVELKGKVDEYHILLLNKKGAFLENFPIAEFITLDCRKLKSGTYFLRLCAREKATPLQEYKLVKY